MYGAFCEKCGKVVEYEVKETNVTCNYKGKKITYIKPECICNTCKSHCDSSWEWDKELENKSESYRKKVGLISRSEISTILTKYKIGKKPLSKLLGWGDVTLTRYLEHDEPSKAFSDTLYKILNDPYLYDEYLENNKHRITLKSYNASRKQLDEVLYDSTSMDTLLLDYTDLLIRYISSKLIYVNCNVINHILFLADINSKMFNGHYLLDSHIILDDYIPKYEIVYKKLSKFKNGYVKFNHDEELFDSLKEEDKEILDVIIKDIGQYNENIITKIIKMQTRAYINDIKDYNKEDCIKYLTKEYKSFNIINIYDHTRYADSVSCMIKNINIA